MTSPQVPASPRTSGAAIAALVLAIGSWVVIPVLPAVLALVLAQEARRRFREAGMGGQGLAEGARIVAWTNIGLWAGLAVLALFVAALLLVAGRMGGRFDGV